MTVNVKAADLPVGSVVAARFDPSEYDMPGRWRDFQPEGEIHIVYVRQDFDTALGVYQWRCGMQAAHTSEVQQALDGGGVVLREGVDR